MAKTPVLAMVQPITLQPYCVGCPSFERHLPEEGVAPVEHHFHPQIH